MEYTEVELVLPKPPSLNMIYAGKHWAVRKKYKDDYKKECQKQLAKLDDFKCDSFQFFITYNSRMDIDNGILVSKFLADTLVSEGIVTDDSPKYYNKVVISYDNTIEKNTYIVKIKCFGYRIV
jgi:hypothetical protein|tara:strand:+ start:1178 stop:1546 length:369 start_codon:yes stop_codon:yes gene_type:complete